MKTLIRLVLTLTVAAVTSLTSAAFADVDLDRNAVWKTNHGETRFYFTGQAGVYLGYRYVGYQGECVHTHNDLRCKLIAWHWPDENMVTFTYTNAQDKGEGTLYLSFGTDASGNAIERLDGEWESTRDWFGNASGPFHLWRLR